MFNLNLSMKITHLRTGYVSCMLALSCLPFQAKGNDNNIQANESVFRVEQSTNRIIGKVLDVNGEPLIGVNIQIKGTSSGVISDLNGEFQLSGKVGDVLVCSYIGYKSQEIKVGNSRSLKITMEEDISTIEEVVVVGYGTAKKSDLTGALSSVNNKQLKEANRATAGLALQGQIAGVDIVRNGNKPGADVNIMVRGQNSIVGMKGGDEITNLNDINRPLFVVDGMFVSSIGDIAPDDIERIDVLKDASSTAIYGSRGANGVVIISTKKGSEGRSFVEYSGTVSFGSVMNLPDFCNADEYMQYRMERDRGEHADDLNYKPDMLNVVGEQQYNNYQAGKFVDWADLAFKTSVSTSHSVRAYGSSRGMNYTFGAGYTSEKGVLGVDGYTRYNVSAAIDKEINKYLKVGSNIYTTYGLTDYSSNELFRSIFRLNPLTDVYNEDGSLRLFPDATTSNISNPLVEADPNNNSKKHKYLHVFGNLFVEIKPISWLKFTTTFTPDLSFASLGEYRGKDTKSSKGNQSATRAYYDYTQTLKYTWDNILYAEKKIGDHNGNMTLGSTWYFSQYEALHTRADAFSTDHYQWYNLGAGTMKEMSSSYGQEQMMSYFARLNYDYKSRYFLTVTGRYDGSSKLAPSHRWAFFPSAALGWRISDEAFLKNVEAISNLKLRLSYGVSGSDRAVSPYQSAQNIGTGKYLFGDTGVSCASIGGFENKTLTWEKTKEVNVGLDFAFFNGRINGTIDWYDRRTADIIMNRRLPNTYGYGSIRDNVGEVMNRGIEIGLNTVNVKAGDFTWSTNINFTKNHNEILALSDGALRDESNGWFVGESIGSIWTYTALGMWQEDEREEAAKYGRVPGQLKVLDKNGDFAYTNEDKDIKGTVFPKWTGGMTNTFKYKNVDLSVFVYTRQGQYNYSQFHRYHTMVDNKTFNVIKLNYWTPENPDGVWPRPGLVRNPEEQDILYYQKTSFVKVGHITLGYNLPVSWTKHVGINKLRIYGTVQNPFVFTDYEGWDPEAAGENAYTQYPMTRTFLMGLNLTF